MSKTNHTQKIAELSEYEGVFTTAQAARMNIPRDALHDAAESGRIQRVARGAYRMTGSGSTQFDELAAAWKLTNPSAFTYERMQHSAWDGIAIGGSTAASMLELGDFHLSPYRIYAPRRINSRNKAISSAIRKIQREEVSFIHGLPVTRQERTIFDLVVDHEDMSLVANAFRDAVKGDRFDLTRLSALLVSRYGQAKREFMLAELGVQTDAAMKERANEI
jgi:predicted transcriptional regulator of viral defense system